MEVSPTITGRLFSAAGRTDTAGITVWFAYRPVDGDLTTTTTVSDADGRFVFDLPSVPLRTASIGASIEGVSPVDLEPDGGALGPGDLVLVVNDSLASHLRYGCAP